MGNIIVCETIEEFTLKEFDRLTNIKRKNVNTYGKLYVGDVFSCDDQMATYLTGGNPKNKVVVKVLEIVPREEEIIPLTNNEELEKLGKQILEHVKEKPKKTTKKKKTK